MARLVLLGGPPGVGKSSVLKCLENQLPATGIVDADDVWRVSDDITNEEHRSSAITNVVRVAEGYLDAGCRLVIVGWVFARPQLYDPVIKALRSRVDVVQQVYLTASPDTLRQRITERFFQQGGSTHVEEMVAYAYDRSVLIEALPYLRLDTTHRSAEQVSDMLVDLLLEDPAG